MRSALKIYYEDNCDDWISSSDLKPCWYGNPDSSKTVVLLGDSIGVQWFPAIEKIYSRKNWRLVVLTKSACPMIDETFYYKRLGRNFVECDIWRNKALDWISELKPDVLIYGNGDSSAAFGEKEWVNGSKRILEKVVNSVGNTFILLTSYSLPFEGPACLSRRDWQSKSVGSLSSCVTATPLGRVSQISQWLESASSEYSNVDVIDMNPFVCPEKVCSAEQNGIAVFRDSLHITPEMAESLHSEFEGLMNLD